MDKLLRMLRRDFPNVCFQSGDTPYWSPITNTVVYATSGDMMLQMCGLLHELAHALLHHTTYTLDIDLLRKEIEAWEEARRLAVVYRIALHDEHIEHCLDSYRDWLHRRSTCPACGTHGVQHQDKTYACMNCPGTWRVSSSRFCRPYRSRIYI